MTSIIGIPTIMAVTLRAAGLYLAGRGPSMLGCGLGGASAFGRGELDDGADIGLGWGAEGGGGAR